MTEKMVLRMNTFHIFSNISHQTNFAKKYNIVWKCFVPLDLLTDSISLKGESPSNP